MNPQTIFKNLFIISVLFSLLLINVGSLRCENKADSIKAQSHARYAERRVEENYEPDRQDEKSRRFEELEWLIKQNLMKQYEKLEVQSLEDSLD